jgi:hypothetical protein
MKEEWLKILVFSILFLVLGFVLGRVTGHCPHPAKPEMMHPGSDRGHIEWHGKDGKKRVIEFKKEVDGENPAAHDEIHAVVKGIEASDFEGDSTFQVGKANIHISKHGEEMNVEVNIEDRD